MISQMQKEKAQQFRQRHLTSPILVLANAWDAASACIFEQVGFGAIGTTSSGVAASLGYLDGQRISREMLLGAVERIARVIRAPLSVDLESGYGETLAEVLLTVRAVIETGAVGINIEEPPSSKDEAQVDVAAQVERLKAIRELASSMDLSLVINSWVDVFLRRVGDPASQFEEAVSRARAYLEAGANCVFLVGLKDATVIGRLAQEIKRPINIIGAPTVPTIAELEQLGVARVSFASGPLRAVLAHQRTIGRELLESGTYTALAGMLSLEDLAALF